MTSESERCRRESAHDVEEQKPGELERELVCSADAGDELAEYTRAIRQIPEAADAYYQNGRILFQKERYEQALSQFQQANELMNGREPEYLYWIGRCYEKLNNFDRAESHYTKTLEMIDTLIDERHGKPCPQSEELRCVTLYVRGLLRMRWGRCDMAREDLDKTIDLGQAARERYAVEGEADETAADPTEAVSEAGPRQAADEMPESGSTVNNSESDQAPPAPPEDSNAGREKHDCECSRLLANAHYFRALLRENRGDFEQAEEDFVNATKCDEKHADAHYRLGCLRLKRGMPRPNQNGRSADPDPIDDFHRAIDIVKDDPPKKASYRRFTMRRARLYFDRKEFEKAIDDFTAVVQAISKAEELRFDDTLGINACMERGLARIRIALARDEEEECISILEAAIADLTNVIRADSGRGLAYKYRADAYCLMRKRFAAKDNYETANKLWPKFAKALFDRALHCRQTHPLDAIEDLSEAIRMDNSFTEAYYNRGLLRQHLAADLQAAVQDFRRVLQLDPGHIYARYQLGRAYGMLAKTFSADFGNNKDREINEYSRLIDGGHDLYFVRVARAEALRDIGEKERAIQDMRAAKQLQPSLLR